MYNIHPSGTQSVYGSRNSSPMCQPYTQHTPNVYIRHTGPVQCVHQTQRNIPMCSGTHCSRPMCLLRIQPGPNRKTSTQQPHKDRSDHTGQTQCQDIMRAGSQGQCLQSTVDCVFLSVLHVQVHGGDGLRGHHVLTTTV